MRSAFLREELMSIRGAAVLAKGTYLYAKLLAHAAICINDGPKVTPHPSLDAKDWLMVYISCLHNNALPLIGC